MGVTHSLHRPTDECWLYLAIVFDLFNREVIGWSLKPRMTSGIVMDALTMVWLRRWPVLGVMHHSDRGSPGGFNRSSQHPNQGGVYGTTREMDEKLTGAERRAHQLCRRIAVRQFG